MNLNTDEPRKLNLFTPLFIGSVIINSIISISVIYFVEFTYGLLIFANTLCIIGIKITDIWNFELRNDGYAAISHLYSSYFTVVFLFIAITPLLYFILNSFVSIIISLSICLLYASLISSVAFRGVDKQDRMNALESYTGPAVVYIKDGDYIKHIESRAYEDRKIK